MSEKRFDQSKQVVQGPQTSIAGAVYGPVYSGSFKERRPPPAPRQAPKVPLYYLPRTEVTEEISAALADARKPVIAITGLEGVGKTTLASAVAERFPDAVLWGDFSGRTGELRDVLGSFLAALNIETDQFLGQDDRVKALRSALSDRSTLIVLDNLSDRDFDPASLLPSAGQSHILLTTPDRDYAADVGALVADLPPFPPDSARGILLNIAGGGILSLPVELLNSLLEQTGGLAALLVTAGQQARRLKRRGEAALQEWAANPDIKWNDLSSLYEFSVSQLSEAEQQALAVVGMLATAPFSPQLIAGALDADLRLARRSLDALEGRSLLAVLPDGRYCAHEAVQKYSRQRFSESGWHSALCRQLTHRLFEWAEQVVTDDTEYAQRLDHLQSVFDVCLQIADWGLVGGFSSLGLHPIVVEGSFNVWRRNRTFLGQFNGCNLRNTSITESNLCGAKFDEVSFRGALIGSVQAAGAQFNGCTFRDAYFYKVDLRAARFEGCNFHGFQMIEGDLRGAQFIGCNLSDNYVFHDCLGIELALRPIAGCAVSGQSDMRPI